MSGHRAQLQLAVTGVEPGAGGALWWFGRSAAPALPLAFRRALPQDVLRSRRHADLRTCLYRNFYCPGRAVPAVSTEPGDEAVRGDGFAERLALAHAAPPAPVAVECLGPASGGRLRVRYLGVEVLAEPGEWRMADGVLPRPGETALVDAPRDYLSLSPGAYVALGSWPQAAGPGAQRVRIYWNLAPDAAPRLLASARRLDAAGIAFRLKVQTALTPRCDAAVLYLSEADYLGGLRHLEAMRQDVEDGLREPVPALTRPLAPGVALAEDPGNGESFGEHRCGVLADGILLAWEHRARSAASRFRWVEEAFARAGLDPDAADRPAGQDAWPSFVRRHAARPWPRRAAGDPPAHRAARVAEAIAAELCRTAIRHGGRSNWVGAPAAEAPGTVLRSLGGDLYGGTAGVGAFLSAYAAATGDRAARRMAEEALAHALAWSGSPAVRSRHGLYGGPLGVALAAARAGSAINSAGLLEAAAKLAQNWTPEKAPVHDLIAGRAGSILALLAAADLLGLSALREPALQLGTELVRDAVRAEDGWAWPSPEAARGRPLTGLSHGTAGIAWALDALAEASGEAGFAGAARRALAYERRLFSPAQGNWPDLRGERPGSPHPARQFSTWWCHGAPGIALSRLLATDACDGEARREEACIALRTTQRESEARLRSGNPSFCLCHGIAGNAEVLTLACAMAPNLFPEGRTAGEELLDEGAERHGATPMTWPSGARSGASPSLMVGTAGIGLAYLRRAGATEVSYLSVGTQRRGEAFGMAGRDEVLSGLRKG